jgi:hypothetical protein
MEETALPVTDKEPRLSVVATSRNDDHGGHLLERMQWFVDGLAWNADRRSVETELVLVEWNPPPERAPLLEVLRWPSGDSMLSVRIVTVPPYEHTRLLPVGGIPMMQMIAKNVGIRRARGDNVLATNIDIMLAPELFDLATTKIGAGTVWRADRNDVEFPFSDDVVTASDALAYCSSHPIRYERRDGIYYPGHGRTLPIYQGIGDLMAWQAARAASSLRWAVGRPRDVGARLTPRPSTHRPGNLRSPLSLLRYASDRATAVVDLVMLPKLNVNACGDFTLLSRRDWRESRGYPELVVHSMHLDTVFMHQMQANGLQFVDVEPPAVAYHMEHSEGSGWTPEGHEQHFAAVAQRGMPHISPAELRSMKRSLLAARRSGRKIVLYNRADWGLERADVTDVRAVAR